MTSTDFTTPMELLGGRAGVSIIDTSSVLKRLWYFDGRFLRASGFRLDQEYVRSLVALSNQAVGHGVVHGYDVDLIGGDALRVEGGLALAPSGRVVYLPQDTELSIAQLIARSMGELDPGGQAEPGVADFTPCPPDEGFDPDLPVQQRPLYVLTVSGAEALCGEEERFGHLCEDACATESDRSVAVEGVRFRVRELTLTLPTSRTVPFTDGHLRSRVASAWFARERLSTPSMISGAGLNSGVWCDGAEGVGGEEVPLAVLDRAGSVTSLLDMWTARRELMEQSPQRYWAWRMDMRPWDVFLAQVLQFQCQLLDLGDGGGVGGEDPCEDERDALAAAEQLLDTLSQEPTPGQPPAQPSPSEGIGSLAAREAGGIGGFATPTLSADMLGRIAAVRARIVDSLSGYRVSGTGSLLLDGGIVEVPSAGYLPTSVDRDVQAQVRALFGPGVDLRFCSVRRDFIPEALQEAQHMDRISLTQGIDDPEALEEVDVLVPGGTVSETPAPVNEAFVGALRILPRERRVGATTTQGSALTLTAVARDQVTDGWSWSLAAYGEAPQQSSVPGVVEGLLRYMRGARATTFPMEEAVASEQPASGVPAEEAVPSEEVRAEAPPAEEAVGAHEPLEIFVRSDAEHDAARETAEIIMRANREAMLSTERRAMVEPAMVELLQPSDMRIPPDRALDPSDPRPMALWFDVETDAPLDDLPVGGRTPGRLRLSAYSRARTSPVLGDLRISGDLVVTQRIGPSGSGTSAVTRIVTRLDGFADPLLTSGGREFDPQPSPVNGLELEWTIETTAGGVRILEVTTRGDGRGGTAGTKEGGAPRTVSGHVDLTAPEREPVATGEWTGITHMSIAEPRPQVRLLSFDLDESPGALDVGSQQRDLADAALVLIGTELALPGRDPGFTSQARARLFPPASSGGGQQITSASDWVMFHRRRTKSCGDVLVEQPTRVRRYRWHHAVVAGREDLASVSALWGRWVAAGHDTRDIDFFRLRAPVDDLGFEPVTTLEFEEGRTDLASSLPGLRTSWSAADRGDRIAVGVVGDIGAGDGETVARGRLGTALTSVSDLIETSGAQTSVLTEVPAEFQSAGIDGVLLTVGLEQAPVPVETVCAQLYRLTRTQMNDLEAILDGRDELSVTLLHQIMEEMGMPVDTQIAVFQGSTLTNAADVDAWWGATQPLRAAAVLDDSVQSDADRSAWADRVSVLQDRLEIPNLATTDQPWQVGDCEALVLIAAVEIPF